MKILEVNDNDIYGKIFNGYDIAEHFNLDDNYNVKQLVINKYSKEDFVGEIFKNKIGKDIDYLLYKESNDLLSVHSLLSISAGYLNSNKYYKDADLVHYHQIHNAHLGLYELCNMIKSKPSVISLHDPWFLTGRCVHPDKCEKWIKGCCKCDNLNTLFPFKIDNCSSLWNIKNKFVTEADADYIVSSKFMLNLVKKSPYFKNAHVHLLPFGIDVSKYSNCSDRKDILKKKYGIKDNNIVIFCRSAEEKGIAYVVDALNMLNVYQGITLLTCGSCGLLGNLDNKYQLIELGYIDEDKILDCYGVADIFLMPSLGESFGMMAIEAMAAKLPVVVFDNTSLPDVTNVPDVGVLVKNLDSKDLANKIELLINNSVERIDRGNKGFNLVKEKYDINIYESGLKKIYDDAYERQKYKLKKHFVDRYEVDYNDYNVQNVLYFLKKLYLNILPDEDELNIFKYLRVDVGNVNNIDYCDSNVEKIIKLFNVELYNKTVSLERVNYINCAIKSSFMYRGLRKIKRRIFLTDIKNNLSDLDCRVNILSNNINNISKDILLLTNNLNSCESNINRVETSFYNMYKSLEYNLWNFNSNLNKLLYEESLSNMHKVKNYNPLVSIIIPAYNASNYLNSAIDSALVQSYSNIEIIVVNDGSNDNGATRDIALSYGDKIKYFEKENGGVSSALNFGIKKMSGEYFSWLSHDDLIDYNHIEKLVEFVSYKENYNKIPYVNFKVIDENGDINFDKTISAQINTSDYKISVVSSIYNLLMGEINGGSVLIKKSVFNEIGYFNESMRITQERDMWSRIFNKYSFVNIPYDTASIRIHSLQVTNTSPDVIKLSDEKNLDILSHITESDIKKLESNINMFYEKIKAFYKNNGKEYMVNKITEMRCNGEKES